MVSCDVHIHASLPERSKGLCSGRNVFVLVGSSPTACKIKSCKIAEKSATDNMDVGSSKDEVKTNARCFLFAFFCVRCSRVSIAHPHGCAMPTRRANLSLCTAHSQHCPCAAHGTTWGSGSYVSRPLLLAQYARWLAMSNPCENASLTNWLRVARVARRGAKYVVRSKART